MDASSQKQKKKAKGHAMSTQNVVIDTYPRLK